MLGALRLVPVDQGLTVVTMARIIPRLPFGHDLSPQLEQARLLHTIATSTLASSNDVRSLLVKGTSQAGVYALDVALRPEPLAALLKAAWRMEDKKESDASIRLLHRAIYALPPAAAEATLAQSARDTVSLRQARLLLGLRGKASTIAGLPSANQAKPLAELFMTAQRLDNDLPAHARREICKLILPMVDSLWPEHADNFMSHVISQLCTKPHLEELLDPALQGSIASMPHERQVPHLRGLVAKLSTLAPADISRLANHLNTLPHDTRQQIGTAPQLITTLVDTYDDENAVGDVETRSRAQLLRKQLLPLLAG